MRISVHVYPHSSNGVVYIYRLYDLYFDGTPHVQLGSDETQLAARDGELSYHHQRRHHWVLKLRIHELAGSQTPDERRCDNVGFDVSYGIGTRWSVPRRS